jgi:hypothetical protein
MNGFRYCSPTRLIPVFISFYMRLYIFSKQTFAQINKSKTALIESFKENSYYFLKYSNNIAVRTDFFVYPIENTNQWDWQYTPAYKLFTHKDSNNIRKCTWFSAELSCEDVVIGDLTEWLDGLKFNCKDDEFPSPICIVQAWAIDNLYSLKTLNLYKIKILNDEMEEQIIQLA